MKGLRKNKAAEPNQTPTKRKPLQSAVWLIKIAVTALALFVLANAIPWRDQAALPDGTTASILANDGDTLLLQTGDTPIRFARSDVRGIESGVLTLLTQVRPIWLLAGAICAVCTSLLLVVRWRFLMADSDNPPSIRWCGVIWARSQVINLLPFGQLGGDAYRVERSRGRLIDAATAFGVVATERIVGLLALLSIMGIGLAVSGGLAVNITLPFMFCTGLVLIAVISSRFTRSPADCHSLGSWRRRINHSLLPLTRLLNAPRSFGIMLLFSATVHLLASMSYVVVDRALGLGTPVWCYMVAVPILALVRFCPIHIAGIGIVEGGLWFLLNLWVEISSSNVIALSALLRGTGLIWSALMAVSFLLTPDRATSGSVRKSIEPEGGAPEVKATRVSDAGIQSLRRRIENPEKILVVLFQGLGDVVLAIPALRQIRARFPDAYLCVAGRSGLLDILSHEEFIDELMPIHLSANGGRMSGMRTLWNAARRIRRKKYDVLINLTSLLGPATYVKCRVFNAACRPRRVVAGNFSDCQCLFPYGERVRFRHAIHEVDMKFRLMHGFVTKPSEAVPKLAIAPDGQAAIRLREFKRHDTLIGICAGGAKQTHRWPVHRFSECMKQLQKQPRVRYVLLGDKGDLEIARTLRSDIDGAILDLTGEVETQELPAVIKHLDVLLTNDTGLMHIAAAVDTPLVAIFGAGTPVRFAPVAGVTQSTLFYRRPVCGPCLQSACSHRSCTSWVRTDDVVEAVLRLAKAGRSPDCLSERLATIRV